MPRDDVVIFFGSARNPLRYSLPQAILATPKIFLQFGQENAPMRPISLRTRPFICQGCKFRCEISASQYGQTGLCSTSFGFSTLFPLQGCNKTAESVILPRLAQLLVSAVSPPPRRKQRSEVFGADSISEKLVFVQSFVQNRANDSPFSHKCLAGIGALAGSSQKPPGVVK